MTARLVAFTFALCAAAAGCDRAPDPSAPAADETKRVLTVDLQEGFDGSIVTVIADGCSAFIGDPRTGEGAGIALRLTFNPRADATSVKLEIPSRQIDWSRDVDLNDGGFLGVSILDDGSVESVQQRVAFTYERHDAPDR